MITDEELSLLQRTALDTPTGQIARVVAHDTLLLAISRLEMPDAPGIREAVSVLESMLFSLKEPRERGAAA